jgi:hypothetical protein
VDVGHTDADFRLPTSFGRIDPRVELYFRFDGFPANESGRNRLNLLADGEMERVQFRNCPAEKF